jgi:hypothetical protein
MKKCERVRVGVLVYGKVAVAVEKANGDFVKISTLKGALSS